MSCPKINLEASTINDDLIPMMNFQEFNQSGAKYKVGFLLRGLLF